MMLASILMLLTAPQDTKRLDIPPAEFSAPNIAFTCSGGGYPTVGIDYDGKRRFMDFNQVGDSVAWFFLHDAIKSVTYEADEKSGERWTIRAEGIPYSSSGIPKASATRIDLTIRRATDESLTADFSVRVGEFSRTASGCTPIPTRPRLRERSE